MIWCLPPEKFPRRVFFMAKRKLHVKKYVRKINYKVPAQARTQLQHVLTGFTEGTVSFMCLYLMCSISGHLWKFTDSFQHFCVQEMLIPRGCPGGCSLWQNRENPFILICEYKSMPTNSSKLPVYHLKHINPEPQGRGAAKEEAPHKYMTLNNMVFYIKMPVSGSEHVCIMWKLTFRNWCQFPLNKTITYLWVMVKLPLCHQDANGSAQHI